MKGYFILFLRFVFGLALLGAVVSAALLHAEAGPDAKPDLVHSVGDLADQPASHTGMIFDRQMLEGARGLLEQSGVPHDRAAAALTSISYDYFRYPRAVVYSPDKLAAIVDSYHAAHWKHLVDVRDGADADGKPHRATDLWLHFSGTDIDGLTVLMRGERDVNVIQVACDLRPLDLVHLSGHFGIPKVDSGAVMAPAPDGK